MKKNEPKAEFLTLDNKIAQTEPHANRFASARPGPASPPQPQADGETDDD